MPPVPAAAIRPPALACVLALAATLLLAACGGGAGATAEAGPEGGAKAAAAAARTQGAPARRQPCPAQVEILLDDLGRLRRQLAVGLSYDQYGARVEQLRASYAAVPIDRLAIACLLSASTASERALNEYIDGVNAWGECLADAGCTTATIEPVLQRKWRRASHFLSEAG
jgi:hypothetical protein